MAIQIRRGSNAEWEVNNSNIVVGEPAVATDSKRAFIGTASGAYMELANLEAIAPAYDPGNSYMIDDYVSYQGKLYVCTVPTGGAWNASAWQVTTLGQALAKNAYSNYETYTMSGDIVSFPNGAGGIPVKDLKVGIEAVQSGSGDPSPTNVRPISGWDEVNVNVRGINQWDEEWEPGSIAAADGTNYNGGTSLQDRIRSKNYIPILPNTAYYFLCPTNASTNALYFYDKNKAFIQYMAKNAGGEFTTPNNAVYMRFISSQDAYHNDISINYPSTDHDYHAYNGTTYTTDLDGTRYGGTLDVTTGVLTLTHGYADLGDLNWSKQTISAWNCFSSSITGKKNGGTVICSNYPQGTIYGTSTDKIVGVNANSTNIYVRDSSYMSGDASAFKTAMSGVQLVYELATPQTYQLTPTQVRTLLGQNNIWCDSGEIEELTYRISNVQ